MKRFGIILVLAILFICQFSFVAASNFSWDPTCLTPDISYPLGRDISLSDLMPSSGLGSATLEHVSGISYMLGIPEDGTTTININTNYNQRLYFPESVGVSSPVNLTAVFGLFDCTEKADADCTLVKSNAGDGTNNIPATVNILDTIPEDIKSKIPPGTSLPWPDGIEHYCMTSLGDPDEGFCTTWDNVFQEKYPCRGCASVGNLLRCSKGINGWPLDVPCGDLGKFIDYSSWEALFSRVANFCDNEAAANNEFPCGNLCSINETEGATNWMLCVRSSSEISAPSNQFLPQAFAKFTGTADHPGNCNYGWNNIYVGVGNTGGISTSFTKSDADDHKKYQLRVAIHAVGGKSLEENYVFWKKVGEFTVNYVSKPSLLVFASPASRTVRYYEKTGDYNASDISFTLVNTSPFTEIATNFVKNCTSPLTCTPDSRYEGFIIPPNGGKLIIPMTVRFSKLTISNPFNGDVNLSVKYAKCENPDTCTKTDTTTYSGEQTSKPGPSSSVKYKARLMNQQDFQTEIKTVSTSGEQQQCIGKDGIVGLTGSDAYPRVNLIHGGGRNFLFDICDSNRTDYVYCMQSEFLVELANKIAKVAELRINDDSTESYYLSFNSYIRDQDFTRSSVLTSLGIIDTAVMGSEFDAGLNNSVFETDKANQRARAASLFSSAKIFVNGVENASVEAGDYNVLITVSRSGKEGSAGDGARYLFPSGNTLDSSINITIDLLGPVSKPGLHWFFYNKDFNSESMRGIPLTPAGAYTTNIANSGYLVKYTEYGNSTENYIYNTFAVPMFVKITAQNSATAGSTSSANTDFTLQGDIGNEMFSNVANRIMFSYWTGFASSVADSNGCTTIVSPGTQALSYREPDSVVTSSGLSFEFKNYETNLISNGKMYLETVLYLPAASNGSLTFTTSANSDLNCFCATGQCVKTSTSCDFSKTRAPFVAYSSTDNNPTNADVMNSLLSKIRDGNVCVYKEFSGADNATWILFWNQQKILKELDTAKRSITDANICVSRPIIG